jgi:hypothetical protein
LQSLHFAHPGQPPLLTDLSLDIPAGLRLLDEPTAGLDKPAIAWLAQALGEAAAAPGRACIIASAWGLEGRLPLAATVML